MKSSLLAFLAAATAIAADPSLDGIRENGAFGFPQKNATVLRDSPELRISAASDDTHLLVQAILWTDDDSAGAIDGKDDAPGDQSSLHLDIDADGKPTPSLDRAYYLNAWKHLPGLTYTIWLTENSTTGLQVDSEGRGAIRHVALAGGGSVRIDTFAIPLEEISRRSGDTVRLAFDARSASPPLKLSLSDLPSEWGIGIALAPDASILLVLPDGPAARAGIAVGDRIMATAEESANFLPMEQASVEDLLVRLRGEKDSVLRLKVRSPGSTEEKLLTLRRETLLPPAQDKSATSEFTIAPGPAIDLAAIPDDRPAAPEISAEAMAILSEKHTADDLWKHIEDLQGRHPAPEIDALESHQLSLHTALSNFLERFPTDPRRWEARLQQARTATQLQQMSVHGFRGDRDFEALALDSEAPDPVRMEARFEVLRLRVFSGDESAIETEIAAFQKEYPENHRIDHVRLQLAKRLETRNPEKSESILRALASSPLEPVAEMAAGILRSRNLLGHPIDLRFTASDGCEIDIQKLRGKVVVIDFWATSCGPCMAEMPSLVAAWHKYHDKGLEVIGISFDHDRKAMDRIAAASGMKWPQYFDGTGWENRIGKQFGISSIPRLWLVNKNGVLVDVHARSGLAAKIERLLAE